MQTPIICMALKEVIEEIIYDAKQQNTIAVLLRGLETSLLNTWLSTHLRHK